VLVRAREKGQIGEREERSLHYASAKGADAPVGMTRKRKRKRRRRRRRKRKRKRKKR
jgi:hypothetical protein